MLISDLTSSGAMPALERVMQFTAQRQRLLASNVANLSTPDYRPVDVDPAGFQRSLREAVEQRRAQTGGMHGALGVGRSREVELRADGGMTLRPETPSGNVLFHDRNNRDLERTMQQMVENATAFRVASDLLRTRGEVLRAAISERP